MTATVQMDQTEQTIRDFGEQWTAYPENRGYYASSELFRDLVHPFLTDHDIRGKRIAEIGSGAGRIVNMLLAAGAGHVVAIEPSAAFDVLTRNVADPARTTLIHARGENLPDDSDLDYVLSIGVIHHIPDPAPVIDAAWRALRPGGQCLIWVYGREGNRLYLFLATPLRTLTKRLPHRMTAGLVRVIDVPLVAYLGLAKLLKVPLWNYLRNVLSRMSGADRRLIIYDQLNPAWARYYTGDEARALLSERGFQDVRVHHRHGYSWTIIGTKPD